MFNNRPYQNATASSSRVPTLSHLAPPRLPPSTSASTFPLPSATIPSQAPSTPPLDIMRAYRSRKDNKRVKVLSKYTILGFISSGTYGRVYKAELKTLPGESEATGIGVSSSASRKFKGRSSSSAAPSMTAPGDAGQIRIFAIKKFKPDKEGEVTTYTGISQSAIREISLNRELSEGLEDSLSGGIEPGRGRKAVEDAYADVLATRGTKADAAAAADGGYADTLAQRRAEKEDIRETIKADVKRKEKEGHFVRLMEVILEDKSIYMVFEFAEHDFLQIIHHHSQTLRLPIPPPTLKSLLHQLLLGVSHLHSNWILHRDLKPANILVTSSGVVKIGDLGLARIARDPLLPLWNGDKVVVTIWYRAPELLLGAKHYTAAIDLWAVGCIYAELLALRPIFKGEEAKPDHNNHHNQAKAQQAVAQAAAAAQAGGLGLQNLGGVMGNASAVKTLPFQSDQMGKIIEILGNPDKDRWPDIIHMPEYQNATRQDRRSPTLAHWFQIRSRSTSGYNLLTQMFEYDPMKRVTATDALDHKFFTDPADGGLPMRNAFAGADLKYPVRRLTHEDNGDHKMGSQPAAATQQGMTATGTGRRDHATSVPFRGPGMGLTNTGSAGAAPPPRKRTKLGPRA